LARFADLGILSALHAGLSFDRSSASRFVRLRARRVHPGPLDYLGLLTLDVPPETLTALVRRLNLSKADGEFLLQLNRAAHIVPRLSAEPLTPSQVVQLLQPFRAEVVSLLACLNAEPAAAERLARYLSEWSAVKPELDGNALRALGIPPGSLYRDILRGLRAARLDG